MIASSFGLVPYSGIRNELWIWLIRDWAGGLHREMSRCSALPVLIEDRSL